MIGGSAEPARISWAHACARRLARQHLSTPADRRPDAVVGAMCGAHAQILSAAELSIAIRTVGLTRTDVRNALWADRSLVKTYGPRGTVHLLATYQLPMWNSALSQIPEPHPFPAKVRLTVDQTDEVVEAIGAALTGVELTIDELSDKVIAATGPWAGDMVMPAFQDMWPRWRQATATAANRGVLCFGNNRGRKVTYTNPQTWVPGLAPVDGRKALFDLVHQYLYSYGPAGPHHFARWVAAPGRWAMSLFDSMADELQPVNLEGTAEDQVTYVTEGDAEVPDEQPGGLRLLPYFDAYVVGSHPREMVFPPGAAERGLTRGQAGNFPVLLIDGTVAGVWHNRRRGNHLAITVEPLVPLTAAQRRQLEAEAERIGEILEGRPELTIGTVAVGPHA